MRPDEHTPVVAMSREPRLIYDDLVEQFKFDPANRNITYPVRPATKREKHKAGRLTARVWDALSNGIDSSTVDDTE